MTAVVGWLRTDVMGCRDGAGFIRFLCACWASRADSYGQSFTLTSGVPFWKKVNQVKSRWWWGVSDAEQRLNESRVW